MVKPTLLVLAAGMGTDRSNRRMDGVGPNNESHHRLFGSTTPSAPVSARWFSSSATLLKRSSARSADRFGGRIAVDFVSFGAGLPPRGADGSRRPREAVGHEPRRDDGRDAVHEPFAVINADDFYGAGLTRHRRSTSRNSAIRRNSYCMVAYDLNRTPFGERSTVSRGVCGVDPKGDHVDGRAHADRAQPDGRIVHEMKGRVYFEIPLPADGPEHAALGTTISATSDNGHGIVGLPKDPLHFVSTA